MAYTRIDGELADFDRDHPWKKEYVSHMEDGIDDCESQCAELKDSLTELDIFSQGTAIPSGSDLNNYTTDGKYSVGSGNIASSLENTPYTSAGFGLITMRMASQFCQFVFPAATRSSTSISNLFYVRFCVNGTWNQWYAVSADAI